MSTERNVLKDFFDSTNGFAWAKKDYWMDEHESHCKWYGVECNDGVVTKLSLMNNDLTGKLSSSIGQLRYLKTLDLSDNDIKVRR